MTLDPISLDCHPSPALTAHISALQLLAKHLLYLCRISKCLSMGSEVSNTLLRGLSSSLCWSLSTPGLVGTGFTSFTTRPTCDLLPRLISPALQPVPWNSRHLPNHPLCFQQWLCLFWWLSISSANQVLKWVIQHSVFSRSQPSPCIKREFLPICLPCFAAASTQASRKSVYMISCTFLGPYKPTSCTIFLHSPSPSGF